MIFGRHINKYYLKYAAAEGITFSSCFSRISLL